MTAAMKVCPDLFCSNCWGPKRPSTYTRGRGFCHSRFWSRWSLVASLLARKHCHESTFVFFSPDFRRCWNRRCGYVNMGVSCRINSLCLPVFSWVLNYHRIITIISTLVRLLWSFAFEDITIQTTSLPPTGIYNREATFTNPTQESSPKCPIKEATGELTTSFPLCKTTTNSL